jgi:glycosyltransferase involved in cell wall biosynthesis
MGVQNMTKFALTSIAFNGYGRFCGQFLAFVANMNPRPNEVVIVLGQDHGCQDIEVLKAIYPKVKIVYYDKKPTFGRLRNIAIKHTKSEFCWFLSIDDKPQRDAIKTFRRALEREPDADYIAAEWYTIGLGNPLTKHKSPTPAQSARRLRNGQKMGFIIAHSPFRRKLWEQSKFKNSDLPNYTFVRDCIINGAKFTQADKPTTTYLRRSDSHARAVLPKNGMRARARKLKREMETTILDYYS